jgi:hypothetical protein
MFPDSEIQPFKIYWFHQVLDEDTVKDNAQNLLDFPVDILRAVEGNKMEDKIGVLSFIEDLKLIKKQLEKQLEKHNPDLGKELGKELGKYLRSYGQSTKAESKAKNICNFLLAILG